MTLNEKNDLVRCKIGMCRMATANKVPREAFGYFDTLLNYPNVEKNVWNGSLAMLKRHIPEEIDNLVSEITSIENQI